MSFVFEINDAGTPSYRVTSSATTTTTSGANTNDTVAIGKNFRFKVVADILGVHRLVLQVRTTEGGQWQTRQIFE